MAKKKQKKRKRIKYMQELVFALSVCEEANVRAELEGELLRLVTKTDIVFDGPRKVGFGG